MTDRLDRIETQLELLAREVQELRGRLARLEARSSSSGEHPSTVGPAPPPAAGARNGALASAGATISTRTIPLVGRTLMVLAGAYLLRALTDSGYIPATAGALIGLGYGLWWLVPSDRAAKSGRRGSAVFFGFATPVIAYPLIWETSTRLNVFEPRAAALALAAAFLTGILAASRRKLTEIAWVNTTFAVSTALGLLVTTHALMPFALVLLVIALAVETLAYRDQWLGLRWPAALGLDIAVLVTVSVFTRKGGLPEGYSALTRWDAISVAVALAAGYVVSIACRTLLRGRRVTPFEIAQAAAALSIGLGGVAKVSTHLGVTAFPLGTVLLALGAAGYAAAFAFVDRRMGRGRNFYFYTTVAAVLTLVGSHMLLRGGFLALAWSILAVAALWLGGRFDRVTLRFHGAVYACASASVGGLLTFVNASLFAGPSVPWGSLTPPGAVVALFVVVGYGILVGTRRMGRPIGSLVPEAILGALTTWIVAGFSAHWMAGLLAGPPGPGADPGLVATSRTAVLSALAVTLAWASQRYSLRELAWLVYPLLLGEALRLILEDLRYGRPVTLFLSLALYGGALIAAPRLLKKT